MNRGIDKISFQQATLVQIYNSIFYRILNSFLNTTDQPSFCAREAR